MHLACQAGNEGPCPMTPNRIGREVELATSPRGRHTPAHDLDPKWEKSLFGSDTVARFVRHRHIRSSISRLPVPLTRIRPTNSRPRSGLHDERVSVRIYPCRLISHRASSVSASAVGPR